jgi:secreted trypsin-like serine protease
MSTLVTLLLFQANMELKYGRETHHHCGGAIIGPHHILTAAHCLVGFKPSEFVIKVGDDHRSSIDDNEQTFEVEGWIVHPKFQEGEYVFRLYSF